MATLKTRIALRNDSSANWQANSDVILLKGEIGIEFEESGNVKMKVGDGTTSWGELDYFGGEPSEQPAIIAVDTNVFSFTNNTLKLLGFEEAPVGTYLTKKSDGTIDWVTIDNSAIENLQNTVSELADAIKDKADSTAVAELADIVNSKANANEVYTKNEADLAIMAAVSAVDHLKREIVESVQIIEHFIANPSEAVVNTIYMLKSNVDGADKYQEFMRFDTTDGTVTFEQIGDTTVDLTNYVTNDLLADTVNNLVNKDTFNNLAALVSNKVDKVYSTDEETGEQIPWTLLSPTDKAKIDSLVVGEDGSVGISGSVNASKVEGLADWITAQRDIVPGLFPTKYLEKIESIENNAQENTIETVVVNGKEVVLNAKTIVLSDCFKVNENGQITLADDLILTSGGAAVE